MQAPPKWTAPVSFHLMEFALLLSSFTGLLAILDPLAVVPVFLTLFGDCSTKEKARIAWISSVTVAITLILFMTVGAPLLKILGISIPAFRVAGGVLLMLTALDMLAGGMGRVKKAEKGSEDYGDMQSLAIVPLAIPLLAGPGAMSTAILLAQRAKTWPNLFGLYAIVIVVSGLTWLTLRLAHRAQRVLGKTGIRVATRIMGLLLASMGIEFIAGGLRELFPVLR